MGARDDRSERTGARRRRRRPRLARVAATALVLVLAASGCILKGSWTDIGFNGAPFFNQPLRHISCPAPDACVAMGVSRTGTSDVHLQTWDGTAWARVAVTSPIPGEFRGWWDPEVALSCWAGDACVVQLSYVASGGGWPITEMYRWGGGSALVDLGYPGGAASHLVCRSSSTCSAYDQRSRQVLRWDGVSWTSPLGTGVGRGVCGADWCVALAGGGTEALHLVDGVVTTSPLPFAVDDLWCDAPDLCHAQELVEEGKELAAWDGTSWARTWIQGRSTAFDVHEVSCAGPDECMATLGEVDSDGASGPPYAVIAWWGTDQWRSVGGGPALDLGCSRGASSCAIVRSTGSDPTAVVSSFYRW